MKYYKSLIALKRCCFISILFFASCSNKGSANLSAPIPQPIQVKLELELIKRSPVNFNYPIGVNVKMHFVNQSQQKLYLRNFLMSTVSVQKLNGRVWKFYSPLETSKPPFEIQDTLFEINTDAFTNRLRDSLLQVELAKPNAKQNHDLDFEIQDAAQSILYMDAGETYQTNTGLVWLLNGSGQYRIFFDYDPNSKYGVNSWFIPLPEQLNGYQRLTRVITSDTLYLNIK